MTLILEKTNQLIELENRLISTVNNLDKQYYTDLFMTAVVDRSLKLSSGFRCLIVAENSQCAAIIARAHIDNVARFHGINSVAGREYKYVYNFLDPDKKFQHIEDNEKKSLTDRRLVEILDKSYPGIMQDYEEFCRYAHLSEIHLRACSVMNKPNDDFIELSTTLSRRDLYLDKSGYSNLIDRFYCISEIFLEVLNNYIANRHTFTKNELPVTC